MEEFITDLRGFLLFLVVYDLGAAYFKAIPGWALDEALGVPHEGPTWQQHGVFGLIWLCTFGLSFLSPWMFMLPLCLMCLKAGWVRVHRKVQANNRRREPGAGEPLHQLPLWPQAVFDQMPVDPTPARYWVGCRFCLNELALTAKEIAELRQALEDAGEELDDPESIAICEACAEAMGLAPTLISLENPRHP